MSEELPEGWIEAQLGSVITNIQTGFACGKHSRDEGGVAHLRPMNVSEDGCVVLDDVKYIAASEVDRDERWLRQGDVLFNNTNSPELVGKTGLYTFKERRAFSNHMTRLRCASNVLDSSFCALALHHRWQTGHFQAKCNNHVSQASVGRELLLSTDIRLPPVTEQHRIVAKVEELLGEVNRAKARLTKVQAILKRFRQSVLAAACSGELTREWREGPDATEPGSQLLDRLLQRPERRRRYSGGFQIRNDLALPELPSDWTWADLRVLADPAEALCYGVVQPGAEVSEGVPLIRAGDLHDLPSALPSLRLISKSVHKSYERSTLRGGELLVTVVGANVGTATLAPDATRGFNIARAVAKIPLREVDPAFVLLWLRSSLAVRWMFGDAREVARPTLNIEQLETLPVPLPPINEQGEIVRRANACLSLVGAAEGRAKAASERAGRLPQAILSKAFSGELVPTEAELARLEGRDYEPASVLLERIKGEAACEPNKTKKRATRRRPEVRA